MKIILMILTVLTLTVSGCTSEFKDMNVNPNAPVDVTPGLLLPNIIRTPINNMMDNAWSYGNIVIQHTAKRQFVNEDRYLWGDVSGPWNSGYSTLRDVRNMINAAEVAGQSNYVGVGLIMRSYIFSQLTDLYGDIPYTQAVKASEGIVLPSYDTQESIYTSMLADLKKANTLLGSTNETIDGDILYSGNITKWKKFANSLSLRLLMRISGKKNVQAQFSEIINNPSQFPIFENNADNAALTYLAAFPNQFPQATNRVGSFKEFTLSKTLADSLNAYQDPRISVFGRPTEESASTSNPLYAGLPNGMSDVDALNYGNNGRAISYVGTLWFEECITAKGIKIAKGVMMTYPELQFILAEAAQKGLISGTALTFYENGVKASFEYFDTKMPDTYLTQSGVSLSSGNPLVKIATQKWISLFYHSMESWADWRRSGLPELKPGQSNLNGDRIPSRFLYPLSEQALNATNLSAAISRQGADDINTKIWWDK
jgi:Starch-binding associating with outer membrane